MTNPVVVELNNRVGAIIEVLETAPRMGAEADEPEGARYIQISDTLAMSLAGDLREFLSRIRG